jgi:hypothetical protein
MFSDIVTNDLVNVRVNQMKIKKCSAAPKPSCDQSGRAGIGGVTVWVLSLTEGTGVGGCGACVGCAPWSAPWFALASSGKL